MPTVASEGARRFVVNSRENEFEPPHVHVWMGNEDVWREIDKMDTVLVKNAERMMTSANPVEEGIELAFADGCRGLIPFVKIPEVKGFSDLVSIELPNPYQLVLRNRRGENIDLPWDFARHYCDVSYRPRTETIGATGRQAVGSRIRGLRGTARLTQDELATAAGIGRVTLVRIENGDQSPRYETLTALARALGRPVGDLLA